MCFWSLEGRGHIETQIQRDYSKQARSTPLSKYTERAFWTRPCVARESIESRTRQFTAAGFQLSNRKRQRSQRSKKILSRQQRYIARQEQSLGLWTSPLLSCRGKRDSQILGFHQPALCLRTADGITSIGARQRTTFQRSPKQKLLRLLIIARAAQVQGSSRDATCSQQLEVSVIQRDAESAHSAFMELQKGSNNGRPNAETCNGLLQLLTSNFSQCWDVYLDLRQNSLSLLSPRTMRQIMDSAIKASDLRAAVEVFRDMQSQEQKPGMITWCYLISSLYKDRRKGLHTLETAYKLWRELQDQAYVRGEKDGSYFATGMTACAGVGEMEEAEDLLDAMQRAGISTDIRAYNILLTGYSRLLDIDGLEAAFAQVQSKRISPSATTYNILINAYIDSNMHSEAYDLLRQAREVGFQPDVHTYSSLIKGAVKQNNLESAMSVYRDMLEAKIEPSVVTMNTLLDGHVKLGRMQDAESMLKAMEEKGVRGNVVVYNTLLRGYARAGNSRAVREVIQRMMKLGIKLREDTFNTLMNAALENDNTEVVPSMFNQLLSLNLRPDSLSYTALITALARMSRTEAAIDAANQLEKQGGLDIIAVNALVAALSSGDRLLEAEKYLKKALELTVSQGLPPPIEAYGALVKAYARLNDATAALDLLAEFQQEGGRLDERMISMGVTACVRAGEFKRALKFVRAMEKAGKNVDKARIKTTLVAVVRLQEKYHRQRSLLYPKNENLERFKFWLGLPNQYYPSEEYDSSRDSFEEDF